LYGADGKMVSTPQENVNPIENRRDERIEANKNTGAVGINQPVKETGH